MIPAGSWSRRLQALWWRPGAIPLIGWVNVLRPWSWLYRLLAGIHRTVWRRRASWGRWPGAAHVPTLVVGNWVVGGAGKTPTTLALLAHLKSRGWNPGVVSRGYGRTADYCTIVDAQRHSALEVGDEPLLIARRAQVPVAVGRDRTAARIGLLESAPGIDIVVADDGLQHHRLQRDLDIAVVDERGAGNGLCLPAGPLREPIPQTVGPNLLVLYSAGVASLELPGAVAHRQLSGVQSLQEWLDGAPPAPDGGWAALRGRALHAAAGIAVPQRFFDALRSKGLELSAVYPLPDHAPWDRPPWPHDAQDAVITEKDAVKLAASPITSGPTRLWVVRLDLVLPGDFKQALDARLPCPPSVKSPHDPPQLSHGPSFD